MSIDYDDSRYSTSVVGFIKNTHGLLKTDADSEMEAFCTLQRTLKKTIILSI